MLPPRAPGSAWKRTYSAEDRDPWLFPDEATAISASVVSAIQSDPKITTTFDAMRKFVWLERLFRAGLSGRLGPSFSIGKIGCPGRGNIRADFATEDLALECAT